MGGHGELGVGGTQPGIKSRAGRSCRFLKEPGSLAPKKRMGMNGGVGAKGGESRGSGGETQGGVGYWRNWASEGRKERNCLQPLPPE